jgi:hypothetical protein
VSVAADERVLAVAGDPSNLEVRDYLAGVMAGITPHPRRSILRDTRESLPGEIFDLVTSRRFCYLGRARTAPYREEVAELVGRRVAGGEPLRFFYDIGPGYHATTRPGSQPLNFEVGLSELLILFQISSLCRRLSAIYPPGAHFWLVIDNLCALRTNDVPLELTEGYCARLRALVRECGLGEYVDLVVESEEFDLGEYDALLAELEPRPLASSPTPDAVANVERFLGRRCSVDEAAERIERYRRTGAVTERLLDRLVRGVHMTQRATAATLGFRPFPGGDSRTQCGEVVLTRESNGKARPVLLTSRNVDEYDLVRLELPDLLPQAIGGVGWASRLGATSSATASQPK